MVDKEKFLDYYYKYLGIQRNDNKQKFVFECNQRDKPINNWYFQYLIATVIDESLVFSISPKLFKAFEEHISLHSYRNFEEVITILNKYFASKIENHSVRKMYRLTTEEVNFKTSNSNTAIKLSKEILMKSLEGKSLEEKSEIWSRKKEEVEQGRQYVILINEKIVSYCKISNIDYGGGNLTVWTAPEYRKKGYGRESLISATKWCVDNKILPIYWVDSPNIASLNLAKSLGFTVQSEEVVVSTKL